MGNLSFLLLDDQRTLCERSANATYRDECEHSDDRRDRLKAEFRHDRTRQHWPDELAHAEQT